MSATMMAPVPVADEPAAAAAQRYAQIAAAIEQLRPYLQSDGGDCELVGVDGDLVQVRMKGACMGCQFAGATIHGLQERLVAMLGMKLRVAPVPFGR
jgi:NifU-like protein